MLLVGNAAALKIPQNHVIWDPIEVVKYLNSTYAKNQPLPAYMICCTLAFLYNFYLISDLNLKATLIKHSLLCLSIVCFVCANLALLVLTLPCTSKVNFGCSKLYNLIKKCIIHNLCSRDCAKYTMFGNVL